MTHITEQNTNLFSLVFIELGYHIVYYVTMDKRDCIYCLLMWDAKTGETAAMPYDYYQDALNALKGEAYRYWDNAGEGVKSNISEDRGEACVNGRNWKITEIKKESGRVAASGVPCCGYKIAMYIPQRSERTGRLMYHNTEEYIRGKICYVPECAFTYAFYCKSDPETRGEYAIIDDTMAEKFGYTKNSIQSMCEFAIRMYYPVLYKRGIRAEAGLDVFRQLGGETVDDFLRDAPAEFIETLVMPVQDSNNIHN